MIKRLLQRVFVLGERLYSTLKITKKMVTCSQGAGVGRSLLGWKTAKNIRGKDGFWLTDLPGRRLKAGQGDQTSGGRWWRMRKLTRHQG